MSQINIYVEGPMDQKFIADFISSVLEIPVIVSGQENIEYKFSNGDGNILKLGGWTILKNSYNIFSLQT